MPEIYLLNACKPGREVNIFNFYVGSIAFRIKILITENFILVINDNCLFISKLNIAVTVNIAIFLKPAFL